MSTRNISSSIPVTPLWQVSLKFACLTTATLFANGASGQADEAAAFELSREAYEAPELETTRPTEMEIIERGRPKNYPAQVTDEGVEMQIAEMGGAIFYPWGGLGDVRINWPSSSALRSAVTENDPEERVERLAPIVENVLPFARIPPNATNVHTIIEAYVSALVATDRTDEAYEISQKLPLHHAPASLVTHLYGLTEKLFSSGSDAKGLRLLNQLYASRPEAEFQSASLSLARQLAEGRFFGPALSLYRPLVDVAEESERKEVALRGAYLALETGDMDAYAHFRQIYQTAPGESDRLGAIELILDSLQSLRNEEIRDALKAVGRALAIIPHDSGWKEIALYYNYEGYRRRGDLATAETILDEMELLFPDGAYTEALKASSN